jgi:hypothetical protein
MLEVEILDVALRGVWSNLRPLMNDPAQAQLPPELPSP